MRIICACTCNASRSAALSYKYIYTEMQRRLARTRASTRIRDKKGNTPLHLALPVGRTEIIEYLLGRGADPNLANDEGFTPLHTICNHWGDRHDLTKTFFKILIDCQQ
uniref:Uncharacterized protein n=1 Tax=Trichogramma kaykai TaxID=54128 RepID=A0ABD2W142_9HYME